MSRTGRGVLRNRSLYDKAIGRPGRSRSDFDHVFAGARVHGDGTTGSVLAKGKNANLAAVDPSARAKPSGGADPSAAVFFYSLDRPAEYPEPVHHDAAQDKVGIIDGLAQRCEISTLLDFCHWFR